MAVEVIWGGEKLHWLNMLIPNAINFGGCMAFWQPRWKRKSQGLLQHVCHFSVYCVTKYISVYVSDKKSQIFEEGNFNIAKNSQKISLVLHKNPEKTSSTSNFKKIN